MYIHNFNVHSIKYLFVARYKMLAFTYPLFDRQWHLFDRQWHTLVIATTYRLLSVLDKSKFSLLHVLTCKCVPNRLSDLVLYCRIQMTAHRHACLASTLSTLYTCTCSNTCMFHTQVMLPKCGACVHVGRVDEPLGLSVGLLGFKMKVDVQ